MGQVRAGLRWVAGCLVAGLALVGCGGEAAATRYHDGLLFLATGNTTGVYYQFGGGYADLVGKYLSGYELRAEATGDSGENVARVGAGDMDLALSHADSAADGFLGKGAFTGKPQRVRAVARLYDSIAQVVVRSGLRARSLADLKGKRVSTGTLNSGSDLVAGRMFAAAGLNPDRDITRLRWSLPETTKGMKAGTVDALVVVDGLPAVGLTELLSNTPGQFTFLPTSELMIAMNNEHEYIYQAANIPKSVYGTSGDVSTITVPTMLLASPDLPDEVVFELTRVLFEHQSELAAAHPDGANFTLTTARQTNPVDLHPGAKKYYTSRSAG